MHLSLYFPMTKKPNGTPRNGVGGIGQSTMRNITGVNAPSTIISTQDGRFVLRESSPVVRSKEAFVSTVHVPLISPSIFLFGTQQAVWIVTRSEPWIKADPHAAVDQNRLLPFSQRRTQLFARA